MRAWSVGNLNLYTGRPEVLFSSDDSEAIAIRFEAGERLADDPVRERTWILPLSGEIEITSAKAKTVRGGPGLVIELNARERHGVVAHEDTLLLLLLTQGPSNGEWSLSPKGAERPWRQGAAQSRPADPSPTATRDEDPLSLDPLSPIP